MDLGSVHACVSACDARYGERGCGWGAVRGPHHGLSVFTFTLFPFAGIVYFNPFPPRVV